MAGIHKRGRIWWISYNVAKKRRRESLETTDEQVAKKKLRKLQYEHATGEAGGARCRWHCGPNAAFSAVFAAL